MKYDVVIIGGGILGCLTARELTRFRLSVLVVDQAPDIAEGATKANTGVLYAGFHPRGGSLKGISCVQGNRMQRELCSQLDVPVSYPGSLFVAFHEAGRRLILKVIIETCLLTDDEKIAANCLTSLTPGSLRGNAIATPDLQRQFL